MICFYLRNNSRNTFLIRSFLILSAFLCLGFFSCSMLGFPSAQSWSPLSGEQFGFAELGTIRVDKNADWDSVEAETRRLLPLFLSEAGYKQAAQGVDLQRQMPLYRVDAVLIEREYMENWKTRRSLSAEIVIWKSETLNDQSIHNLAEKTPLAAGKALVSGNKSLSSSKALHDLLKAALTNAIKALPKT